MILSYFNTTKNPSVSSMGLKFILGLSLIGVLVSLASGVALKEANARLDSEWKEIFSNGIRPLSIGDTLKTLQQLDDFYSDKNDDSNALNRSKQLRPLIDVSRLAFHKCVPRSFKSIDDLLKQYESNLNILVPYLQHYRLELFKFCSDIYSQDLEESEQYLSSAQLHQMAFLRDCVLETDNMKENDCVINIPDNNLYPAILDFVEMQSNDVARQYSVDKHALFGTYQSKCQELAVGLCHNIVSNVVPSFDLTDILRYDTILSKHLDKNTIDRMTNLRICEKIVENPNGSCFNSYNVFSSKLPGAINAQKKRKSWINFWKNKN